MQPLLHPTYVDLTVYPLSTILGAGKDSSSLYDVYQDTVFEIMGVSWEDLTLNNWKRGKLAQEDIKSCFLLSLPIIYSGFMSAFNILPLARLRGLSFCRLTRGTVLWGHAGCWQDATVTMKIEGDQNINRTCLRYNNNRLVNFTPSLKRLLYERLRYHFHGVSWHKANEAEDEAGW